LNHTHAIPNILLFTPHHNLLTHSDVQVQKNNKHDSKLKNNKDKDKESKELRALAVQTRDFAPSRAVRFLTLSTAPAFAVMGDNDNNIDSTDSTDLVQVFFTMKRSVRTRPTWCRGAAPGKPGSLTWIWVSVSNTA
jgi:hypothetical protein